MNMRPFHMLSTFRLMAEVFDLHIGQMIVPASLNTPEAYCGGVWVEYDSDCERDRPSWRGIMNEMLKGDRSWQIKIVREPASHWAGGEFNFDLTGEVFSIVFVSLHGTMLETDFRSIPNDITFIRSTNAQLLSRAARARRGEAA